LRTFNITKNKIENRSISLDVEFDNEGTTLKDFMQETESFEAEHNVHSKRSRNN
jgi:hypothetical protein